MTTSTFSAFKGPNYRLFFAGQSVSLLGTWMQKTAVSWVIYTQTQSKFMLGVTVFATLFPSALCSPFGGVISDRYNRYRVLLFTQILSMIQAILLTAVVFFKQDAIWPIIGLSVLLGVINGFDVPARQSLVYDLVDDKRDIPNAVALNSLMVNLAKLIGPALAGVAIEKLGDVVCFGLNALSFVAVIGSLLLLKLPAYVPKSRTKNIIQELQAGFAYVRATPAIRFVILMLGLVCLLVMPFTTLMAVYAKEIFRGTASTFGLIDGSIGLGAFIGAIYLASLKPGTNLSRVLAINTFVFGTGLILFSYTPWYPVALFFLVIGAFGMMSQFTISNTLVQTLVASDMRGRTISIFIMVFASALPVGSLLVGAISERIGVQATVLGQGVLALGIGVLHLRHLKKVENKEVVAPIEEDTAPEAALHL